MQKIIIVNSDNLDILSTQKASFGSLNFGFSKDYIAYLKALLKNKFAHQVMLKDGDDFVGYVAGAETFWENSFAIVELFVHPKYQKKSLGAELLSCCEEFARKNNLDKLIIQTEKENLPAIKLYEKYGFRVFANLDWEGVSFEKDVC